MKYNPEDGRWVVSSNARGIKDIHDELGNPKYENQKKAIKTFLCGYFSTGECRTKQGQSISPLGATSKGGKALKVRWALPGGGKSGGLRLIVVAYCTEKKVVIAEAFRRKDDPSDEECEVAYRDL